MSKKLDSILERVPSAVQYSSEIKNKEQQPRKEISVRLGIEIPILVKKQIKHFVYENSGETERTVVLRGLRALGFDVSDHALRDNRGKGGKS